MTPRRPLLYPWLGLLALSAGCAGSSYERRSLAMAPSPLVVDGEQSEELGGWAPSEPLPAGSERELAAAALAGPAADRVAATGGQTPSELAERSVGSPMLIYRAELSLGVFEVDAPQRAIEDVAFELGGFLVQRDERRITIRVPSSRFRDAMGRIERVGDVLRRSVSAQDVSEEYRDIEVRLKNAEAVRARLEALLAEARDVAEALRVQTELAKVTETIEAFKGRIRFLSDRVAFSTISIWFQLRPGPSAGAEPEVHRLPVAWLDELGLSTLLNLR